MNRITKLFEQNPTNLLSVYFTAGFPTMESTTSILQQLYNNKVDLVEIGIPFSDPIADGPVIQSSNDCALSNGMTLSKLFIQLKDIRNNIPEMPMILMGYLNPIIQFGVEEFCRKSNECGIDGIILPDLPLGEYVNSYQSIFEKYNLKIVFLITQNTSDKRIEEIDHHSGGFIYVVSSNSTTGTQENISDERMSYFKRISEMELKNKTMIGFGISNNKTWTDACKYSNGAIIGSAFIKHLSQFGESESSISNFIENIKTTQS